ILGNYCDEHEHPLGNNNLRFTQIPKDTRKYIARLLRFKVAPEHIVRSEKTSTFFTDPYLAPSAPSRSWTEFIQLCDICQIKKEIEAETIRLHLNDGQS
ncbi:hypothetical protein B0H19DRAFT_874803, partial [Mycena capillaripes]